MLSGATVSCFCRSDLKEATTLAPGGRRLAGHFSTVPSGHSSASSSSPAAARESKCVVVGQTTCQKKRGAGWETANTGAHAREGRGALIHTLGSRAKPPRRAISEPVSLRPLTLPARRGCSYAEALLQREGAGRREFSDVSRWSAAAPGMVGRREAPDTHLKLPCLRGRGGRSPLMLPARLGVFCSNRTRVERGRRSAAHLHHACRAQQHGRHCCHFLELVTSSRKAQRRVAEPTVAAAAWLLSRW